MKSASITQLGVDCAPRGFGSEKQAKTVIKTRFILLRNRCDFIDVLRRWCMQFVNVVTQLSL